MEHGTRCAYVNSRCRCVECREANALYHRERRHRYWPRRGLRHGTVGAYSNYLCRCPECCEAKKVDRRRRVMGV